MFMSSDESNQNLEWLKIIKHQIQDLDETLSREHFIDIVSNVHRKYKENEKLQYEQQIPYAVFEKLTELLQEKAEYLVNEKLLNDLKNLPANAVIIQPLIEQQEILLLNHYNELINENSNNVDILFKRAIYYFSDNELELSLSDFNKIIEIDPNNKQAIYYRIKLELKQRNYIEAYQELNDLVEREPDNEFALFERALLYLRFNYSNLAFIDIQKLKKTNNIEYLLLCAREYLENNYIDQVINICRRVLNKSPEQIDALLILGKTYFQKQEYEKAIKIFELALDSIAEKEHLKLQKNQNKKLDLIKYIGDAKCKSNNYIDGLHDYLKLMALGEKKYLILREYIKVTEEQIDKEKKQIDKKYLNLIVNEPENLDLVNQYVNILESKNDIRGCYIKYKNKLNNFSSPENTKLNLNESEFLERVKPFWIEPNMLAEFEKGFPRKVTISNTQDIPYLERLPWIYTVRRLEIIELSYDNSEAISILFEQNLPALRELLVHAEHFGYFCTKKLVKSPFFDNLESLILTQCNLDAPSLKLIIKNLPRRVKELRLLYGNAEDKLPVNERLGKFFSRSDRLQKLECLDLTDCSLNKEDVEDILSLEMPSLRKLNLAANDLSQFAPEVFLKYSLIRQIEELSVSQTGIEKELLFKVLEDFNHFNLKRIDVQGNWNNAEINDISQHNNFNKIEKINFGYLQTLEESLMDILE